MNVLDEKYAKIDYDEATKILTQTWNGFASSENFRHAIDKSVEFSDKNKVSAIISDTSNQSIVKKEDTNYAASVMPTLIGNGLIAMAFVVPENIFTQMSVKNFKEGTKDKSEEEDTELVKFFNSVKNAKDWIDSKLK